MLEPTKDQKRVCNKVVEQYLDTLFPHNRLFELRINGYAGTGKTFLLSEIRKNINKFNKFVNVAFCTFTGKASVVVEQKLIENRSRFGQDYVGTIHGLIYEPITRYDRDLKMFVIVGWRKKDYDEVRSNYDMIIVDEASMISKKLASDLRHYDLPIIWCGDHGQLPPIGDMENIIKDADYTLTEIHRQALNSPLIKLAHFVRVKGFIPINTMFSNYVFKLSWSHPHCKELFNQLDHEDDMIVLCGFNKTRVKLNKMIREKFEYTMEEPYIGEKVICLKNNKKTGLMNGHIGRVKWVMPADNLRCLKLVIDTNNVTQESIFDTYASLYAFNNAKFNQDEFFNSKEGKYAKISAETEGYNDVDLFDFGYAISVHKSQGSEWRRVVLFEQYFHKWQDSWNRWLYTAVTRAKEKLFVITDFR